MRYLKNNIQKIRVMKALGADNLLRLLVYRAGIYTRIHPVIKIRANVPNGSYFRIPEEFNHNLECVEDWWKYGKLFGAIKIPVSDDPPEWTANPLNGKKISYENKKWWDIPDFDSDVGDIKLIWELSRYDWVLALSQRIKNGDKKALDRLNVWLNDWCKNNPPYYGPNWKCGQEASIRIMHLAIAAIILDQVKNPESALKEIIYLHLLRIAPTISYAIAQDNNHGTSEAAALFIGGSWLVSLGVQEAKKWYTTGRKWLENRVERLIDEDGGFSQYSVNYHRMMLDTLSIVEIWRRNMLLDEFSKKYKEKAKSSARWLAAIVDHISGDAPNIGANDGARLLQIANTDYRDFRPSVQLAMVLHAGEKVYKKDGPWNESLKWLKISIPEKNTLPTESKCYDGTGFALLNNNTAKVILRYPRFRFRPSHSDVLHIDLWVNGNNILRDSGTYSYNDEKKWSDYYPGTISHNTIQFDDRDQMPRIGRFMFGEWIKTSFIRYIEQNENKTEFVVAYCDRYGASHKRKITLEEKYLLVTDDINGFNNKAVLRWRLMPGEWNIEGKTINNGKINIEITSDTEIKRIELVKGWESRYYYNKNTLSVIEVETNKKGRLITKVKW